MQAHKLESAKQIESQAIEEEKDSTEEEEIDYREKRFEGLMRYTHIFLPYGIDLMDRRFTPRLKEISNAG